MILPWLNKGYVSVNANNNAYVLYYRCWSSGQPSLNLSKHFLKRGRSRRKLLWKSCKVSFWAHVRNFISFDKFSVVRVHVRLCYPARESFLSRFDSNRHSDEAALHWEIRVVSWTDFQWGCIHHLDWIFVLIDSNTVILSFRKTRTKPEPNQNQTNQFSRSQRTQTIRWTNVYETQ